MGFAIQNVHETNNKKNWSAENNRNNRNNLGIGVMSLCFSFLVFVFISIWSEGEEKNMSRREKKKIRH